MNLIVIQSFYYWKPILREKIPKMKTTPFPKDIHGNNIYNKEVLETALKTALKNYRALYIYKDFIITGGKG